VKRAELASSIGALAGRAYQALPRMVVHQHLRDAATALRAGNHAGARRHLHAAANELTPQSLHRHGVMDDESHQAAKGLMDQVNRHAILVSDHQDQDVQQQTAGGVHAIELARRAVGL
jgi:hypothetical protein